MIGIEPSLTLGYRQEYTAVMQGMTFNVYSIEEWLSQKNPPALLVKGSHERRDAVINLLPHCGEKTIQPLFIQQWQTIFSKFGFSVETIDLGCCGMAGNYGLEREHQTTSHRLFEYGWREALKQPICLATGFSCRSQAHRLSGYLLQHPISFLMRQG